MRKSLVALSVLAATALPAVVSAADYSDDIHKNDYKWLQFNIMQSVDNKIPFGNQNDTYLEIEFGGRSGIVDLYAYVDVFDIFNSKDSDRHDGDNFFMKFAPRFSIDGMLGKDLSFGPVQELYISTVTNVGDGALFDHNIGLGSDIMVPWFGKIGVNTYARYVRENYGADNEGKWDGFQISTNWFKPFVNFDNGSFIAYQGYLDYKFGADEISDQAGRSDTSLEWFNGFYWHSDQWAVGYGLKVYDDMALLEDGGFAGETSGIGHYFDVTYKF
ncbi:MAG: outer membrane protein OmpK [Photobacterium frigidiphilum]|uniref:nucleoside-specific channel-forming Tsx family protein n=1 Tax=Photobacterium frigidiphilum TaxID=264736 RepID=UPI003002552D